MESLAIISSLTVLLILYGIIEFQLHQKNLFKIPIRIHINGTRGKSSVSRLIGAGLRSGGFSTITKVTGTFPRMIMSDGTEVAVHRKEKANILEQLGIIKYTAQQKADVLLIECMALNPIYQRITEHQMVKATHGVITNIRLDHLDVMGPNLENVADALSLTIPKRTKLFTAETRMLPFLEKKAAKNKTKLIAAEAASVSLDEMKGFTYLEHPENVALALDICMDMGIDRNQALTAMKKTFPDEGALRKFNHQFENRQSVFYNALAANDPESSMMIWNNIKQTEGADKEYVILINCRKDRKERSETLIKAFSQVEFDHLILSGENVDLVKSMATKNQISPQKITLISESQPASQAQKILTRLNKDNVIVAFGNMGAGGAELSKYFELQHQAA